MAPVQEANSDNLGKFFRFSVLLSLPLIQEEQLSVSGERMCTMLVSRLED